MQGAWAWARADIRGRWRALVALGLLIGLLAATGMTALAGARRTSSAYDRFRDATLAHDVLTTVAASEAANLERIARLPEVTAASVGTIYPVFRDIEGEFDLGVIASKDGNIGRTVNKGKLLRGHMPRADQADEVLINDYAADQLGASVGSIVRLGTLTPAQIKTIESEFSGELEGPALALRVAGVVRIADDLTGDTASSILLAGPAFNATYESRIGAFAAFGSYRLRGGTGAYEAFAAKARPLLGTEGDASMVSAADTGEGVHDALRFLAIGLALAGALALVVGSVAGGQALARQLGLAGRDQPALAALGLTRADRSIGLLLVTVPVAVVAGTIASVAAFLASPLTPINIGRQAEPHPGLALDPLVHLGGGALTAVAVLFAGAAVGWLVAGAAATEGERDRARPSLGAHVGRALGLGPGGVTGVRMAFEPGRGATALPVRSGLVAAVVAVAGLIAALTFGASLQRLGDTPARFGKPWDYLPDVIEGAPERWARSPVVSEVGVINRAAVVMGSRGLTGYALVPVKGSPQPTILRGRAPAGDREVALGTDLLEQVGVGIGDTVRFTPAEGAAVTFRVVGTFLGPAQDQDPIAGSALFTPDALDAVAQSEVGPQGAVRWRDDVDPAVAERRFRAAFSEARTAYAKPRPPGEVVNLGRVEGLPPVLAGFFAVVGGAGLLHLLLTSTRRRRHDFAVLRSIGFVRRQVAAAVSTQATAIIVIGLLVGVPVGVALGRWAWILTADNVGVATDPLVPVALAAAVVPAALVVANLLGAPLGRRAARIAPATVLRTE